MSRQIIAVTRATTGKHLRADLQSYVRYLLLDCMHWIKWTNAPAPKRSTLIDCPICSQEQP